MLYALEFSMGDPKNEVPRLVTIALNVCFLFVSRPGGKFPNGAGFPKKDLTVFDKLSIAE